MQLKEINARLEKTEPKSRSFDGMAGRFTSSEVKAPSNAAPSKPRHSPKATPSHESSLMSGLLIFIVFFVKSKKY